MLHSCNIESWVNNSPDKQQQQFREAVHVVLLADLENSMIGASDILAIARSRVTP